MKNLFITKLIFTLLIIMNACSSDEPAPPVPPPGPTTPEKEYLSIKPIVNPMKTKAGVITDFVDNDELGLFVTDGELGGDYNNNPEARNLPTTFVVDKWVPDKKLEVVSNGTVFAYYPYNKDITSGTSIPVETTTQTDYLYAEKSVISAKSPEAILYMKHALSLVSIRVRKNDYQHAGRLEKIEIIGIQTTGTLNIATGTVTKTGEASFILREPNIVLDDNNLTKTSSIILPTNMANTTVKIKAIVDGNTFFYDVPVVHNWEAGNEYIYTLNLNKMQEIDPDVEFEVEYWSKFGKDDNIIIGSNEAYSKLDIQMGTTSYGRTLVKGEAFIFEPVVTNKNTIDFQGRIKLTLWQGDKMIEQFPAYNIIADKKFFTTYSLPSFVNCAPGTYKLRPLLQEEGKTDWFIASDRYSEETDWMFTVQEDNKAPSLSSFNIEGYNSNSDLIRTVEKGKPFDVEYTLTNRAGVALKGEIKAVWERTFTGEFRLPSQNDGNIFQDIIGYINIDVSKDIKKSKGSIPCCITIERNSWVNSGPEIHLYYKAEGATKWTLMRSDADQELQRWKNITGPEEMFIYGGVNYIYVTLPH